MSQVLRPKKIIGNLSSTNIEEAVPYVVANVEEVTASPTIITKVEDVDINLPITDVAEVSDNLAAPVADVVVPTTVDTFANISDVSTLVIPSIITPIISTPTTVEVDIITNPVTSIEEVADVVTPAVVETITNIPEIATPVLSPTPTPLVTASEIPSVVANVEEVTASPTIITKVEDVDINLPITDVSANPVVPAVESVTPLVVETIANIPEIVTPVLSPVSIPTPSIVEEEIHNQPPKPEISDALQKLLDMKIGKTLANAKASLEEKEPTILNNIGEIVLAKPNLGKEIRVPRPAEVVVPQQILHVEANPVVTPQFASVVVQPTQLNTAPVIPATTINNVSQQNNLQPTTVAVPITEVVPKKSLLDRFLGF